MRTGWIVGLIVGSAALVLGQGGETERQKSGIVSGQVIDGKSSDPVRKARVILRRAQPGTGIGTMTDATGKFTLQDVEPGSYSVSVDREGYVAAPESLKQVVAVKAGETTADLKVKLLRTGVITGRVLDEDGEPVRSANIQIVPSRRSRGARSAAWAANTDDRGEYRAFNIAPGEYKISATYSPGNQHAETGVHMQAPTADSTAVSAYPPVYYPGTFDPQRATAVTIEPGSEMPGVDFHLIRHHAVTLRGRVTGLSSSPAIFAIVTLSPAGQPPGQTRDVLVRDPDGRFELRDILPGTYRLAAESGLPDLSLTGWCTLEVGSSDIEGIQLAVSPSRTVNGHILVPKDHKLSSGLMILLESREPGDGQRGGMTSVEADGSFAIPSVPPGQYSVLISSLGGDVGDLYIGAIHLGDLDALAEGVVIGAAVPPALEITLKPNGGTLESSVTDEKGAAIPTSAVVLVPDAPRERQMALYGECRTSPEGNCRVTGIAPGEYHAFAFLAEEGIDYRAPDALKPFEKYGKAVKFTGGEKKTLALSAAPVE